MCDGDDADSECNSVKVGSSAVSTISLVDRETVHFMFAMWQNLL